METKEMKIKQLYVKEDIIKMIKMEAAKQEKRMQDLTDEIIREYFEKINN